MLKGLKSVLTFGKSKKRYEAREHDQQQEDISTAYSYLDDAGHHETKSLNQVCHALQERMNITES